MGDERNSKTALVVRQTAATVTQEARLERDSLNMSHSSTPSGS